MTRQQSIQLAAWFACLALVGMAGGANAQASDPKGPAVKPIHSIDLASEIDSVRGRVLRAQITTYAPGSATQPHSHKERPEIAYVLSGKIIEHRGDVTREYGPGDTFTADRNTTHWMENKRDVPVVMLVTGIAKED